MDSFLLKHSLVLVEEDQYTSFHDAILESVTCCGTQINVSDLRQRNLKLKFCDHTSLKFKQVP